MDEMLEKEMKNVFTLFYFHANGMNLIHPPTSLKKCLRLLSWFSSFFQTFHSFSQRMYQILDWISLQILIDHLHFIISLLSPVLRTI
jgi:hypothetical protein